jgi:hypothetical protein
MRQLVAERESATGLHRQALMGELIGIEEIEGHVFTAGRNEEFVATLLHLIVKVPKEVHVGRM